MDTGKSWMISLLNEHGLYDGFDGGHGVRWVSDKDANGNWIERRPTLGDFFTVIEAACKWQRERDADIALKVASGFGAPDAYWVFADSIRDQKTD